MLEGGNEEIPSPKQVESRWRTMTKQYKAVVDHNRTSGNNRKSYKYYNELDEIQQQVQHPV